MSMQTILGSGGAIGIELAKALKSYTTDIRLVSRHPKKVNDSDELVAADPLNPMTEATTIRPPSKKGEIRAQIAQLIMDRVNAGRVKALIARSADFYGPSIQQTSVLTETVFKPLCSGQTANWFLSDSAKHSFTYTPDAGKATALLGNTDRAYGQVWHLPTAPNPMTGKEWVETIASKLGKKPAYRVAPLWMIKMLGWFMPIMKESVEMVYQYDRDYVFDSSQFEKEFGVLPTSYADGIKNIVERDYN